MADKLNWGILATGNIARQFAEGLKVSKTGNLVAVGSRTLESAQAFTEQHGGKPYGSYEELLADPDVQAVYIATPHHLHYDWTIRAAEAKKAILCEKPFTLNAIEAQRALNEVRSQKVFFMEAFMYRCQPQTQKIREWIDAGEIGTVRALVGEFGYRKEEGWDNFRTEGTVGGGALMDVGLYPVSFARLIAGEEPDSASYTMVLSEKGADVVGAGILRFPSGIVAHFGTAIQVEMRNDVTIYGEKGRIHVPGPWKIRSGPAVLERADGSSEQFEVSTTNAQLYAYEADEVFANISRFESDKMSWDDTLGNMRTLDMLRQSAGLKFSQETLI